MNRARLHTLPPLSLLAVSGLALALCLSLLLSSPIQRKSVFRKRDTTGQTVPEGYTHNGKTDPDVMLNLRMALRWYKRDALEEKLYDVSDPKSANYGKHLTVNQVKEYVQPSEETTGNVTQWLQKNDVAYEMMGHGEWLKLSASVSQVEKMLNANFNNYTHDATGRQYVRSTGHEIPSQLKEHIKAIHPVTGLPTRVLGGPKMKLQRNITNTNLGSRSMGSSASVESILQSCSEEMTPSCVYTLYNIPNNPPPQSNIGVAVEGNGNNVPIQEDLESFIENFRQDVTTKPTFQIVSINGGVTTPPEVTSDNFTEVDLDMQSVLGIAPNATAFFLSDFVVDDDSLAISVIDANIAIPNLNPLPLVLTASFGFDETNPTTDESDIAHLTAICDSFIILGALGITTLFASGDGGVNGGFGDSNCTTRFVAVFPASCPYVTAVGATQLGPSFTEIAANFSSGGFSNIFPMPPYQSHSPAVSNYLERIGNLNKGLFNPSGRAFPDVSTIGSNIPVVQDDEVMSVQGTSASSPLLAGILTLINGMLTSTNRSPLGFLNPLLYSGILQDGLNDITQGNNPGCGTNGFPAAPGWDPVTGFGTPNFPPLIKALGL